MRDRVVYHWKSEEKILEDKLGLKYTDDIFRSSIKDFCGRRVNVMLRIGERINVILISADANILALRAIFPHSDVMADLSVIPLRQVVAVAADG